MKKQISKIIAVTLACAMVLPNIAFASNRPSLSVNEAGGGTISSNTVVDGDGTVDKATYQMILPSKINFAVDQFQVAGKDQIYGSDYYAINRSEFAVRLSVTVSNNSASANALLVAADDPSLTAERGGKAFHIAAVVPDSFSLTNSISANGVSANDITANYSTASNNSVFGVSTAAHAEFTFALDKYDDTQNVVSENNCATFTFGGKINPYAKWLDNDIKVKGVFTFVGLPTAGYVTAAPDAGNNLTAGGGGGGTSTPTTTQTITRGASIANAVYNLAMPSGAASVSSVSLVGTGSNTAPKNPANGVAWTYSNGKLTFLASAAAMSSSYPVDTYTVTVTFSNAATKTLTLIIR